MSKKAVLENGQRHALESRLANLVDLNGNAGPSKDLPLKEGPVPF